MNHEFSNKLPVSENVSKNQAHYNRKYARINAENILRVIDDPMTVVQRNMNTQIGWHALYQNNFAKMIQGKTVLELGCGDGLNATVMAMLGAHVTAIDISEHSERLIRDIAGRLNLTNLKAKSGDFLTMKFDEEHFDFIVGLSLLHHLTHELEKAFFERIVRLVHSDSEIRFSEPAENSRILNRLRYIMPVPGRPSMLNRHKFHDYQKNDPHPVRDNSGDHYRQIGHRYFNEVNITPFGCLERFSRLMPKNALNYRFRAFAFQAEKFLPQALQYSTARTQLIIFRQPKYPLSASV